MSIRSYFRKYQVWYAFILIIAMFFVLPAIFRFASEKQGVYIRLLTNFAFCISLGALFVYMLFAPAKKIIKKGAAAGKMKKTQRITIYFLRVVSILMILIALYSLIPLVVGSYYLVRTRSFEVITGTVIDISSSTKHRRRSTTECLYIACAIKLDVSPQRSLEYMFAPRVHLGGTYEFIILPHTNVVLGSR